MEGVEGRNSDQLRELQQLLQGHRQANRKGQGQHQLQGKHININLQLRPFGGEGGNQRQAGGEGQLAGLCLEGGEAVPALEADIKHPEGGQDVQGLPRC